MKRVAWNVWGREVPLAPRAGPAGADEAASKGSAGKRLQRDPAAPGLGLVRGRSSSFFGNQQMLGAFLMTHTWALLAPFPADGPGGQSRAPGFRDRDYGCNFRPH